MKHYSRLPEKELAAKFVATIMRYLSMPNQTNSIKIIFLQIMPYLVFKIFKFLNPTTLPRCRVKIVTVNE